MIQEEVLPRTNAVRVSVIWDRWEPVPDDERVEAILQAYEQVEGQEFCDRIALALGVTVSEAVELGLLPYQVIPLVRQGDLVTYEQCRDAMIAQGASVLLDENRPLLRFATIEEAEACIERLKRQLPGSDPVWTVNNEPSPLGVFIPSKGHLP